MKRKLTFQDLARACLVRWEEWMGSKPNRADLIFTTNELAGEAGEACNFGKKLERARRGVRGGLTDDIGIPAIAEELADVVICANNTAQVLGINLEEAVIAKFNKTSAKNDLITRFHDEPADGVELIAQERLRQIAEEGFTAEHDDEHRAGELAEAASCYAAQYQDCRQSLPPTWWPWDREWWKPTPDNRIGELVRAGALIAAEIDRLQRLAKKGGGR